MLLFLAPDSSIETSDAAVDENGRWWDRSPDGTWHPREQVATSGESEAGRRALRAVQSSAN
jgi:hypothetical protein